jgi:serine/threonine-protein kinase HipA
MTALEAIDGNGGDWVDVVDFARLAGSDTVELWRRAVFGCVVGNFDDHMRNHGFLHRGPSWMLAPAFDVNPEPLGGGNKHQLALVGNEVSLDSFMAKDALSLFGTRQPAVQALIDRLQPVLKALPRYAAVHGAGALMIDIMKSRVDDAVAIAR